ncbi:bifunctional phosphopantothenoylcysteine decarboxylase/phosphopantothenate--cysteine ligase CoaBC [bacterium]|nr:bifunctional phosphopantothenoylcysteine decarboxylase/phosphopantothenate--cysteine ligase CoaBC [bacterium]
MQNIKDKKVILGVTGSIAVYKIVELVRAIIKSGGQVKVVQTESSRYFVGSLTFETLTRNKVYSGMFDNNASWEMNHISLADWGDILVIAPATANIIAKAATGIADDLLSTLFLAFDKQVLLVPAMNVRMFNSPATQKNIQELKERGIHFIEPEEGLLASGQTGKGRMPEIGTIFDELVRLMYVNKDYMGKRVLVTAGRTEEMIDPVRILTNRATGKMGIEIARAARNRGAEVTLILGPTHLKPPLNIKTVNVTTAEQMHRAVESEFNNCDILVMTAAVADFTPEVTWESKIKKASNEFELNLKPTVDILGSISANKGERIVVGFALETENEIKNAEMKLKKKLLDYIVVNNPLDEGAGFGTDTNVVRLISKDGHCETLPKMLKSELADIILDRILGTRQ